MSKTPQKMTPWICRYAFPTLALLLVSALSLGCGPSKKGEAPGPAITIALSLLSLTDPLGHQLSDSFVTAAKEQGFDTLVTSGEYDNAKQIEQIEAFINRGVKAIFVTPCDPIGVVPAIQMANQAGIPVVTLEIAIESDQAEVLFHVGTNHRLCGQSAAQAMVEVLGGQGSIAVLDHGRDSSANRRADGFREAIVKLNERSDVNVTVLASLVGAGDRRRSADGMAALLNQNPGLNGVYAVNDSSALGAVDTLVRVEKEGIVVVIGYGGDPEVRMAIKAGKIFMDLVPNTAEVARLAVSTLAQSWQGAPVAPEIWITARPYYGSDADSDAEIQ